jgi:CAAX prenyl protease-like protein
VIRSPAVPYVLPFAIFLGFLALRSVFPLPELTDQILRLVVLTLVLIFAARPVIDLRVQRAGGSILVGVAVFALWIAPDLLFPGYRQHWLFENSITGSAKSTLAGDAQMQPAILILRTLRAVVIVPIVEELFWRGWLMRWLIAADFRSVPLGAYTAQAFWVVAVLFASEHGAYWDVGLMAGIAYNWWMLRTRSLGDLILAHAVTNACLSAYVIVARKWEYWL